MKRTLVILALVAVAVAAGWFLLRGATLTFTFTEQQLAEQLAKRFPVHKTYLVVIGVHYENPRVRLTEGASEIGIGVDARVDVTVNSKELKGSADLLAKIAYDADNGTFVLHDARMQSLHVAGVGDEIADRVKLVANELAVERVGGIPIYKLRPTDVKTTIARLVLKSVTVRNGVLVVEVGL